MKFDDTKKIFENWKHNVDNRLDEMFVSSLEEAAPDEPEKGDGVVDAGEEDEGLILGEDEPDASLKEEWYPPDSDLRALEPGFPLSADMRTPGMPGDFNWDALTDEQLIQQKAHHFDSDHQTHS